ncbi:major facilitator superfamily domain-containing protein [Thelonectria olida]|uniref:Major facilitator superfamily domain-containing protein n=1 Tax=Thelonectria olida TaxID=1576542 RepID=A0A9P9AMS0_9HYPO|nr:major facilitator superfamily domain-containing protein [Thelonectria olida]
MARLSTPELDIRSDARSSPNTVQTPKDKSEYGPDLEEEQDSRNEPQPHVHAKTWLALFAICLIYFSQTFVLVGTGAQGQAIAVYLNRSGDAVWLTATLTIPSVVLGPIVAQTADYWGRKWLLVGSCMLGTGGCLIASRATTFSIFLLGQTITGLHFGVLPLLHAIPSEILPRRWRAPSQAAVMIANSFGLIIGLILGGVFTSDDNTEGFRNYFYIATGLLALGTIIGFFAYTPPPTPLQTSFSLSEKLSRLDWIGYILLASSLVLFCIGLCWSQNPYPWSDAHTLAPFAIGVALGIALVVYETKFKTDGMFHHGLFQGKDWNFAISLAAVFCEGVAFFATTVYFPFQVGFLYEADPLLVGVRFSIAFIATIPASVITGLYCTITKKVRWVTVFSFIIFVVFFVCMATSDEGSGTLVWGYPVLLGSALGMTLITLVTVAQLCTPPQLISIASGLIISIRSLGGTVGIAIYNAVMSDETSQAGDRIAQAALEAGLPGSSLEQFVGNLIRHNETGVQQAPGVTPEIVEAGLDALVGTFVKGFQHVWITAAAFVSLAVIATIFLTDPSDEFNNRIDAPVEDDHALYGDQEE